MMSEDLVILELNARWSCEIPFGWFPIYPVAPVSANIEVYDSDFFHLFDEEVKQVLLDVFSADFLYEIEEGGNVKLLKLEESVFGYDGLEHIYTDSSFRFVIYFSHESSVTVGGDKLLEEIHRIWPEHSMHFWPPDSWL